MSGGIVKRPPLSQEIKSTTEHPLAERVRPRVFDDVFGQDRIWAPGSPLRTLVEQDRFTSLIFWGPPGTGKTTLAVLIGRVSAREVVMLSAVHAGVKEIREHLGRSEDRLQQGGKALLMFMDEIHRLSKSQQDVLLPALEQGLVKFIGATTENPSFEVNAAINSRSLVFRFERLSEKATLAVLGRALESPEAALPRNDVAAEVLQAIAKAAAGDGRRALNLLEAVILSAPRHIAPITADGLRAFADALPLRYDKAGDEHYDVISAFIKSIRASHPDAAVYYLARMLESGEDPMFIARRLVIAASEDVGNANPTALLLATAAMQAVHLVGLPEARIMLAQATTYLASSPKSNRSYMALEKAAEDVKALGALDVPMHLRNGVTNLMKQFGYGKNYAYAHDDLEGARKLPYLPEQLKNRHYYEPKDIGAERQLKEVLSHLRPTVD